MRGSDKLSTVSADSNRSPFRPRPRATTLHVESRWHALRLAVQSTRAASPRVSGNVYASSQKWGIASFCEYIMPCECHTHATVFAAIDVHPIFRCTKLKRSCRRVVPVHRRRVVTGAPRAPNEAARLPPCDSARKASRGCRS